MHRYTSSLYWVRTIETAIPSISLIYEDKTTDAILLVEVGNVFNVYSIPSRIFAVGRTEISPKEGMTKDDLISMVIHGFGVTALIEMLLNIRVARTIANIVGNNTKGRISKREFQKNKARQTFRKTNISYLLIRTRIRR